MAYNLSPIGNEQFVDANGAPYSGAKLFTYLAGSSTKTTTYHDNAGATPHTNPIILNTKGEVADGSGNKQPIWLPSGQSYKFILAPSTDTDPPTSSFWTLDNIVGINDTTVTISEWITGPTPTYVSATSFTLVGDQTTTFNIGRRLKTTNSGGTIYSTIVGSAFTSLTTITVINDSGTLDSGLSAVSYGILSSTNNSVPSPTTLTLLSNDATASVGPIQYLYRNSTSPAASDLIGEVLYDGNSSTGVRRTYARSYGFIDDPTNAAELGRYRIAALQSGSEILSAEFGAGQIIGSPTGSFKGDGTLNTAGPVYKNNVEYYHSTNPVPIAGLATVSCLLQLTGAGAVNSGAATHVSWNSEVYDASNLHDNVTNPERVIVPTGYIWARAVASINWASNATGDRTIEIRKNDASIIGGGGSQVGANGTSITVQQATSARISVVATDYLSVVVTQTSGGSLNVQNAVSTYFWVEFSK